MPEHVCHCSVKIEELSVRKGSTEILNQVNLTANHGEILALIGRNGAGKTTLLKAILGQTPYSGRISDFNCQGKRIDRPRIGSVSYTHLDVYKRQFLGSVTFQIRIALT